MASENQALKARIAELESRIQDLEGGGGKTPNKARQHLSDAIMTDNLVNGP
jgi:hypothetical protein